MTDNVLFDGPGTVLVPTVEAVLAGIEVRDLATDLGVVEERSSSSKSLDFNSNEISTLNSLCVLLGE